MSLKNINNFLNQIGKTYHEQIPLSDMFSIIKNNDFIPIQEEWSGFLCGSEGRALIELINNRTSKKKHLCLSWYRMPSGKYEVTSYVT
jgi:hypothetical protein